MRSELVVRLPSVTAGSADSGALALGLDDVGGVGLGHAARGRSDFRGAGDDLRVVGLGLGDGSASLAPGGFGESLSSGRHAGVGVGEWNRVGDHGAADNDVVYQN